MMPTSRASLLLFSLSLLIATSCEKHDNAAETDKTSDELRKARTDVAEHSRDLTSNQDAIEQQKRALVREQQELVDKQKLLDQQRQQLGSALGTLAEARAAYAAAVKERGAKLDASLATLATKTDAKSKDALAGLQARRDQLAAKLAAMSGTPEADWNQYTKDIDVTFGAIERDTQHAIE